MVGIPQKLAHFVKQKEKMYTCVSVQGGDQGNILHCLIKNKTLPDCIAKFSK